MNIYSIILIMSTENQESRVKRGAPRKYVNVPDSERRTYIVNEMYRKNRYETIRKK